MLVKILVVFSITTYVYGQLNGDFWWMNDRIARYHNTVIQPPHIEDLPEYETDDSVKITFRDSEFDQNYSKFREKRKNSKLNQDVPKHDNLRYPSETNTYKKYQHIDTASNFDSESKKHEKLFTKERTRDNNLGNSLISESLVHEHIGPIAIEETTTTKQITSTSKSVLETRAPFASFNDYMNFMNVNQKPKNTDSNDICTYIKPAECERRKGLVFILNAGRNQNNIPKDPNLICCTLIPKSDVIVNPTEAAKFIQKSTVGTINIDESSKIVPDLTNVNDYISKYGAEKSMNGTNLQTHDVSNVQNKNNIHEEKSSNIDSQKQGFCEYISKAECDMRNGIVSNQITTGYPGATLGNSQQICCILQQKTDKVQNTNIETIHMQENNIDKPKSTTNSRNEFSKILPNIDDYISKFAVIKNTNYTNLLNDEKNVQNTDQHSNTQYTQHSNLTEKDPNELSKTVLGFTNVDDYISKFGMKKNVSISDQRQSDAKTIQSTNRPNEIIRQNLTDSPNITSKDLNKLNETNDFALNLSNIDDYISNFGIIKKPNNSDYKGQNNNLSAIFVQNNDHLNTSKSVNKYKIVSNFSNNTVDNYISKYSVLENNNEQGKDDATSVSKTVSNVLVEENITEPLTTTFNSPNKSSNNKNRVEKVRTTAIPFKFPDKENYIDSYNNELPGTISIAHGGNRTMNQTSFNHKTKKVKISLLPPKIDDLISKYGVNTDNDTSDQLVANNNSNINIENHNRTKAIEMTESTTIFNVNMTNCTFINKFQCITLKGNVSPYLINDIIPNDQQKICCILPLNKETYTNQSTKVNKEIKVISKNTSETGANQDQIIFFNNNNLIKYPKTSIAKPATFVNNFNKSTQIVTPTPISLNSVDKNANNKETSKSICTYIKEHECKQRRGFVYGIQYGKSMTKGPRDPELVCCILLESENNNDQVKVVAGITEKIISLQTIEKPLSSNVGTFKPTDSSPTKKFTDHSSSSISSMEAVSEPKNTEKNISNKRTDNIIFFPDENKDRYKRSNDDNVNSALKQRLVLLQRRFTTQPPKPDFTKIKIGTPDYDEDPYWNVKNLKFHNPKTTSKNKCGHQSTDYYVDELPSPGLKGLYSDHGSRPNYETDYNVYDYTDYEDTGISFGYSTVDPRLDSNKRKIKLQTKRPKSTTKAPEIYDPEKLIVNFQSNPDFHVFQNFKLLNLARRKESSKTKYENYDDDNNNNESPLIEAIDSSTEYNENYQLFKDCGRRMIRPNFQESRYTGETQNGSHPWLALVVPTYHQQKILCYATLIHPKAAITTADCVYEKAPGEVTVIAGIRDLNHRSRVKTRVPTVHVHPEYNDNNFDNNIAILSWSQPLKLGINIQPACLNNVDSGEDCMIFGWNNFGQAIRSRSKWQRVTTTDCDGMQDFSEQEIPSTAFCGRVESRGTVSGKGGPLICTANGRQSLVGVIVQETSLVFLPARSWALKAGNFMDED